MPSEPLHVLVVGAGIGGLALAVALQRAGLGVTVVERAKALAPVGAGLAVQLNALEALATIGLADAVAAAGCPIEAAVVADAAGHELVRASLLPLVGRAGRLPVAIHRATLHDALRAAFDGEVLLDAEVTALEEDAAGVTLRLADGGALRGDVLVGADGLRSRVRRHLRGEEPLRYAGYTSWRGVCQAPEGAPLEALEAWGAGQRFGCAPIDGDRVYWFATADAPEGGHDGPDPRAELLARFAGWAPRMRDLIAATPTDRILRTDIHDRPPIDRWSRRRVTLLGDAAHPMTPNLGQGACQAIEDAVALARALAAHEDHGAAFAAYEAERVARTGWFVERSRLVGVVGQVSHPLACGLRDLVTRLTPPAAVLKQYAAALQAG